jgi:acetyl-CoA carboxylase carboxyl transferase subunit alpha
MPVAAFDFEKPIVDLEKELDKLRQAETAAEAEPAETEPDAESPDAQPDAEAQASARAESADAQPDAEAQASARAEADARRARIAELDVALDAKRREIYAALTPWQRVQIARHAARPHSLDYIRQTIGDWTELRGDRAFGDDKAVITGLGRLRDRPVAVVGQQKGANTMDNIQRNFGMMHPEGYRKALRVMRTAEKFEMPVLVFIDTPGAFPGIGAEERGQAEAIARNMMEMSALRAPIVVTVIGEGASGGALGVGVGDRLLMLEYAWYCVISPEGCASILWRDAGRAEQAAEALKLTAEDLKGLGIVDAIVPEPLGGAHRDPVEAADNLRAALIGELDELAKLSMDDLLERRFAKYRRIGEYVEA